MPSATELQELERRTERRALENMTDYFEGIALEAQPAIAYVASSALSGVAWDDRRIVTPPFGSGRVPETVTASTESIQSCLDLDIWGPHLPLAALVGRGSGPD